MSQSAYPGAASTPEPIGFWAQVREDWKTHDRSLTKPGLHALLVHRLGRRIGRLSRGPRGLLSLIHHPLFWFCRNVYGIELPAQTSVGRRVKIAHQSGIVIHHFAVIGDDCLIRQNVTIGGAGAESAEKAPVLGNGVQVGAGAVIMGGIQIGEGVRIGPNAVVTMNVPAGAIVVMPPPRVITPPNRHAASDKLDTVESTPESKGAEENAR